MALAGLTVLAAGGARAVIPSGRAVLDAAKKAQPQHAVLVVNLVPEPSKTGKGHPEPPVAATWRVAVTPEGRVQLDRYDPATGAVGSRVFAKTPPDPPEGVAALSSAPPWLRYLIGGDLERLVAELGVDTKVTSLAHAGRDIVWVLGAGPREADRPQLHVERESGALRRIVWRDGETVRRVDLSGANAKDAEDAKLPRWPTHVELVELAGPTGPTGPSARYRVEVVSVGATGAEEGEGEEPRP